MVMRFKLKIDLGKFKGDLMDKVAGSTDDSEKLQVRIRFLFRGTGVVLTTLDTLSIATMKELSGKDWVVQFESANFATLC